MASKLTEDGESTAIQRTWTLPFMAVDLLLDLSNPPEFHYYRHSLESLYYILIWAAVHYDFKRRVQRPTPKVMALWAETMPCLQKHLFGSIAGL